MRLRALLLAVLLAVGVLSSAGVVFDPALDGLLPATGEARAALTALRTFPASEVLVFAVDGEGHADTLGEVVSALAADLRAIPGVRRVDAGFDLAQGAQMAERVAEHAAALVPPDALRARTRPDGIREALLQQRARLEGPAGAFLEGRIERDPLDLETLAITHAAGGQAAGVSLQGGLLTDPSGRYALLLVQPLPAGQVDDPLVPAIEAVIARQPVPVYWTGGPRFAADAQAAIRRDVAVAGLASALVLAVVLVVGFRSWRPLAGTVPAVLVAGAGAAVGAWWLSPIHPVQLAFSGALAGIAADYWIHLYLGVSARPGQHDAASRFAAAVEEVRELWSTLALNAGATTVAFSALMASDVPAVRVLGFTGAAAAIAAFVATVVTGPLVWAWIGRPMASRPSPVVPRAVQMVALGGVCLVAVRAFEPRLQSDPMALIPRSAEVTAAGDVLRTAFGMTEARGIVVLEDADPARLLDRAAAIEDALERTGIADPVGPGSLLPGPAARAERRAALPPLDVLQRDIDRVAEEVGFAPFPGAAERIARSLEAPIPEDLWRGTVLEERVAAHRVADGALQRALITTPLVDPIAAPFLSDTVQAVDPDATWLVPTELANASVARTSQAVLRAAGVGALVLAAFLGLRYRDPERAIAALLPALASVACASGGLAWVGQPWDIVSVTVMALVVGLGVDYGIFLVDAGDPQRRAVASQAIALSSATTVAGFLPLVAATTPVLRSVGWTLLFGIGGATLTALVATPWVLQGWPSPRVRAGAARLAWLALVAAHLDVALIVSTAFRPPALAPLDPGADPGRLERSAGLWVLSTSGGPVEAGTAAGALTRELRPRLEEEMLDSFQRLVSWAPYRWAITRGAAVVGRGLDAELREEDRLEIAATAAADPDLLWLGGPHYTRKVYYHAIHDLGQALVDTPLLGCTGFIAGPGVTRDGGWLLGRDFDFEGGVAFDRDKVVRVHRPAEGIPYLSVAFAGLSGAVTGVNRDGIAIAINAAASDATPRPGTPMTLIVREILETASSLDDAERILRQRTGFVAENVMVVDADAGEAAVFEVDPDRVVRVPVDGAMAVSNHFRSAPFAEDRRNRARIDDSTTLPRLQRMEELLDGARGQLDLPRAASVLTDRAGVGGAPLARGHRWAIDADLATHGVIIDATRRVVWVSRFPNLAGGFAELSLEAALAGDLEAREVVPADEDAEVALEVRRGRELLRACRRSSGAEAVALADQAAALLPGHPEALFEQGRSRVAAGDRAGAEPFLRAALAASPEYREQRVEIEELLR